MGISIQNEAERFRLRRNLRWVGVIGKAGSKEQNHRLRALHFSYQLSAFPHFRFRRFRCEDRLADEGLTDTITAMRLTVDQIVAETNQWPLDAVAELVDRITLAKHGGLDANREDAWAEVAVRRSSELDTGKATLVPGNEVSARIRKIVGR